MLRAGFVAAKGTLLPGSEKGIGKVIITGVHLVGEEQNCELESIR